MVAIVYMVLGYWAVGKVLYEDKIVIYSGISFFCKKMAIALLVGWALFPIAIIKTIFGK